MNKMERLLRAAKISHAGVSNVWKRTRTDMSPTIYSFEDDEQCCWKNEDSSDKRDWLVGKQEVDKAKFDEHFNGALPPEPKYAI